MKEAYFTRHNLTEKAKALLATQKRKHHAISVNWQHSALLVLDMQLYFLDPAAHAFIPSAAAILPNLQKLITAFSQKQRPIIFTRHINTPANAGTMIRWWRDLIHADDPHSVITSKLNTHGHLVIDKSQYDAFYQTDLDAYLKRKIIQQVVVTGVMTHLCCETTARSAFMRGFDVFFTVDGTATYNQDFHQASLLNLGHGFATPLLTQEILEAFANDAD